jgi:hypothetical protein
MSIKINEKILSIPPYISTNWSRIMSLYMKGNVLAITLNDGNLITIPELPSDLIESIFNYHAAYLDKTSSASALSEQVILNKNESLTSLFNQQDTALQFGIGSLDGLGNPMQHNPAQASAPDLPPELLQKVTAISKILTPENTVLPKPEPGCNCFHCQLAKALNPNGVTENIQTEEEVLEQDLQFQQWTITQVDENLFSVINRLDQQERYSVYLGQPLGCTCGQEGCEHIVAVLKS